MRLIRKSNDLYRKKDTATSMCVFLMDLDLFLPHWIYFNYKCCWTNFFSGYFSLLRDIRVHTQTHIQIDIYMLVYARCRVVEPFNLDAIGIFEVWCQYCYFVGLHLTNKLHDFDKTSDTCSLSLAGLVEKWDFIFFLFMRCKWYIQFSCLFSMRLPNGAGHISLT